MSSRSWRNRIPQRYVNSIEKAEQELARRSDFEVSDDSTSAPEATPAPCLTPFLAYHEECTRWGCTLGEHDRAASLRREVSIAIAMLGTYLARAGA